MRVWPRSLQINHDRDYKKANQTPLEASISRDVHDQPTEVIPQV